MTCDFCEFEDNVSKLNKYKHPDGWLDVKVTERYTVLHACPKCTRLILLCGFMTKRTEARAGVSAAPDPEILEQFFPNFKKKRGHV